MVFSKPNNKRKINSVLVNPKKYVKKNNDERVTSAEDDIFKYFKSLSKSLFDKDREYKGNQHTAKNLFDEIKGKEVYYASTNLGCRVIKRLLPLASPEVLESFSESFSKDLYVPTCSNEYARAVIVHLIRQTANRATEHLQEDKATTYPENHVEYCRTFTLKTCTFLLNNIEDLISNIQSNHLVRACLMDLTGMQNLKYSNQTFRVVPEEFSQVAVQYCQRLSSSPQFTAFPYVNITTPTLQAVLMSLTKSDNTLLQKLINKLVPCFAPLSTDEDTVESAHANKLAPVFNSEHAIKILELAILKANEKNFEYIYTKCFKNNVLPLSVVKTSSPCVQKLLECCKSKELFKSMFNELSSSFGDILTSGCTGILVALASASRRLVCQQKLFIKSLSSALHCEDNDNSLKLASLTVRLLPLERAVETENLKINPNGLDILKEMIQFKKPIEILNGLLSMPVSDIVKLFCDERGCNVADAFFGSEFIGEESREKMCEILKGAVDQIISNKNASHLLEYIKDKKE